jgi:hypothetical protein
MMTDLYSYEKDSVIVAADFMKMELNECLGEEKEEKNDDHNRGVVYEVTEETKISEEEREKRCRRVEINNLRKFLEGKYKFEEGETLAAFDEVDCERQVVCTHVFTYIQSLNDYDHIYTNWSLDDASLWALDIADWHFGVLNAAEIFLIVNMMMEDMSRRNSF